LWKIFGGEALMVKKQPNHFRVKLTNCGIRDWNVGYDIMKDTSALKLIFRAVICMLKSMIGEERINEGIYYLGMYFLKETHKRFDELFPEMKGVEFDEIYTIKEEGEAQ
jgi:hypothetical protein